MSNRAARSDPGGRLIVGLGRAGLLPFFAFALLSLLPDYRAIAIAGFQIYGLAILAFLCGTLWGRAIETDNRTKLQRLWLSNLLVIVVVLGWVMLAPAANSLLQLSIFWLLYLLEALHSGRRNWYLGYRLQLTSAVTPAYLITVTAEYL